MKKLFSILMVLCLLCTAVAALAEDEVPTFDAMPKVVTVDEDVELTDADFEGDWIMDKVFLNQTYLTPEEVEENGLVIHPMTIAEGKIVVIIHDEDGDHEATDEYTLENNQILYTDGQGIEVVIEKLEDGNLVMSIFLPGEDETVNSVSYFLVHPEA